LKSHRNSGCAGFTLIEIMIVVAIIGILSAIALPSYRNYVLRGKIVDATNALSAMRAKMEQFYQDNRTYTDTGSTSACSLASNYDTTNFHFACSGISSSGYTITASGQDSLSEFKYSIDADASMVTTSLPGSWGTSPTKGCWITRPGGAC
jgi:type IV pilus assembly protein PilE